MAAILNIAKSGGSINISGCFHQNFEIVSSSVPNFMLLSSSENLWHFLNLKGKLKASSYIAQYPVLRTAQSAFTLYFPDRPVHSDTISASLGSIQPYATINARRLTVHISTTVYSQVLILFSRVNWRNVE